MWKPLAFVLSAVAVQGAVVAAPPQDRPGFPTQARVFIENGRGDAVPVTLVQDGSAAPERVTIVGTAPVSISGAVQVQQARQAWDYRTLAIAAGQDLNAALTSAGADGWELLPVAVPGASTVTLVMKRPH
jgi:hypothetical protein